MVIDANVLAAYFLERGPKHERARSCLGSTRFWIAPSLWRTELLSILRKYRRATDLSREAALIVMAEAEHAISVPSVHDPALILDLAETTGCSVYDAEYVATAVHLGLRLVTFDRFLLQSFPLVATEP